MTPYPLLLLLAGSLLFQITDENIMVPALSSPVGVEASIQVKLLEERLPGAVFSILLKFETPRELVLSQFTLEEQYKKEWELLPAGAALKTKTLGKVMQAIPFILRAKKTGAIDIPNLEASAFLDAKDITFVWKNWLMPEKLFPFKELDTPQIKDALLIDSRSPWLSIGLLLLIAMGVLGLIKKKPTRTPSKLNVAKELETWLKKVDALTLEECIAALEPILALNSTLVLKPTLQGEIPKQADAIATQELNSAKFKELTQTQRLMLEKALQALEDIKYSKNKDRTTLIFTVHELAKTL